MDLPENPLRTHPLRDPGVDGPRRPRSCARPDLDRMRKCPSGHLLIESRTAHARHPKDLWQPHEAILLKTQCPIGMLPSNAEQRQCLLQQLRSASQRNGVIWQPLQATWIAFSVRPLLHLKLLQLQYLTGSYRVPRRPRRPNP